jgi:hypothetical protein
MLFREMGNFYSENSVELMNKLGVQNEEFLSLEAVVNAVTVKLQYRNLFPRTASVV